MTDSVSPTQASVAVGPAADAGMRASSSAPSSADGQVRPAVGRSLVVYGFALAGPGVAAVVGAPILTRLLGTSDYGQYTLVLSLISACSALNSWAGMSVVRFYASAEQSGTPKRFFRKALQAAVLAALTIALIGVVATWAFSRRRFEQLEGELVLAAAAFVAGEAFLLLLAFSRARGRARAYLKFNTWRTLGPLAVGVLLALVMPWKVMALLAGHAVALTVGLLPLWRASVRDIARSSDGTEAGDGAHAVGVAHMVTYGVPLMLAEFAAWGLRVSDRWLIGVSLGASEVGVYSAAYVIAEAAMLLVISVFQTALRPLEVRVWESGDQAASVQFAQRTTGLFLVCAIPVAMLVSVLGRSAVTALVAPEYARGSVIVPWVAWGIVLLGLQQRFQAGLIYAKRTKTIAWAAVVACVLNVSINASLLPQFGIVVAGISTAAGYAAFALIVAFAAKSHLRWRFPWGTLGRAGTAGVASGIVAWSAMQVPFATVPRLVVAAVAGGVAYVAILLATGEIRAGDLHNALRILKPEESRGAAASASGTGPWS